MDKYLRIANVQNYTWGESFCRDFYSCYNKLWYTVIRRCWCDHQIKLTGTFRHCFYVIYWRFANCGWNLQNASAFQGLQFITGPLQSFFYFTVYSIKNHEKWRNPQKYKWLVLGRHKREHQFHTAIRTDHYKQYHCVTNLIHLSTVYCILFLQLISGVKLNIEFFCSKKVSG